MGFSPRTHLGTVHVDGIFFLIDPSPKRSEHLIVGVFAHACVEAVVPSVDSTDEVGAVHMAISQQRPTVKASAVIH
jgi:hypothetical protein